VTIDKLKKLITLKWGTAKKEKGFSEIQKVIINKEESKPDIDTVGYAFYGVYLEINHDKFLGNRILIAKEREKEYAESLAETISQFMNVTLNSQHHEEAK
nr:hypothetical protein [bacterium]